MSPHVASILDDPLNLPPVVSLLNSTWSDMTKTRPSFHLLVPATDSNANLCKTLLSSFVLSYPPPTLINWGKKFDDDQTSKEEGSHTAKIRGVFDYLNDKSKVKDNDLVLIVDGHDIWFQLPPQIMIERYYKLIADANERLRRRYGMVTQTRSNKGVKSSGRVVKYTQKVIFGADKVCWPNPKDDPACAAVPHSTLPKDVYGPETDEDPEAFLNRPRYLNSGNVIGPAAAVRDIYEYAAHEVQENGRGDIGDQFVFAEIFGEQEFQRETNRRATQGTTSVWFDWISDALGTSESPLSINRTINNMTYIAGQRYEFSMGLDYESRLFQTMTHSAADVEYVSYNSTSLSSLQATHPSLHRPLFLPPDLQTAQPPISYVSPGNHTSDSNPSRKGLLLPYSPNLDTLPTDPAREPTWLSLPLATNIYAASIPTVLHINGDKSLLTDWWPSMWYHPFARALLRRFIRSSQTSHAAASAAAGGLGWWDSRGGRGGVWTDNYEWMAWGEVCKGTEDEVFGDGKGVFGKEDGSGRVVNAFGKVLVGDDEEDD